MAKAIDKILLDSVRYLADWGFSARMIAKWTGLSEGQVAYRIRKMDMSLRAYRDGDSDGAHRVVMMTPCVKMRIKASKGERYKV